MYARRTHIVLTLALAALISAVVWAQGVQGTPQAAPQTTVSSRPCHVAGHLVSGLLPLPGVAITALAGEKISAITSSDAEGGYSVPLAPGTYTIKFALTGFVGVDKTFTLSAPPCDVEANLTFTLAPPGSVIAAQPPAQTTAPTASSPTTANPAAAGNARGGGATTGAGAAGANANANPNANIAGGRGGRGQAGPQRFQSLTVQQSAGGGDDTVDVTPPTGRNDDPAARLLPPGFSPDAPVESVAVNGTMVELDRNMLNERLAALGRGEFGLGDAQFGQPGQQIGQLFPGGGGGDAGGRGGRGGGPGGGGGPGLGGRIGGANRLQISANYSLGGSMFDAAPYQLVHVGQTPTVQPKRNYTQQSFSGTVGGALKIPHIYNGTAKTTFNLTYTGNQNGDLFDQYATVPSGAFRAGDFSSSPVPIIDPQTGLPFPNNKIPDDRISQAARTLLQFIPEPTIDGATPNFRRTATSYSATNSFSLRLTHTLIAPPANAGRGGGRGGTGGGGRAGAGGGTNATAGNARGNNGQPAAGNATSTASGTTQPTTTTNANAANTGAANSSTANANAGTATAAGTTTPATGAQTTTPATGANAQRGGQGAGGGRGGRGNASPRLNATLNATINYRRNTGDRLNVFQALSGTTAGSTLSVPITLNMRYGRSMHAFSSTFNQTKSTTLNSYAFNQNIVGTAGIGGVSTDPFDWGVPSISFGSGFTALRDVAPSKRTDRSYQLSYTYTRPTTKHAWRIGGSYQQSSNQSQSDANARGSYTFTGLYTAGGLATVRGSGQDFADFLLGLPQQATRQYSVNTNNIVSPIELHGKQASGYFQDDWRLRARWTINYGLQYDFIAPFTEANGHMVNLDANSDFTAVAAVEPGQAGPFDGKFPAGLVRPDWNNFAPRVGAAWRATNRSVIRFGYGLTYNAGAYSTIARQLTQQPPFFLTGTSIGSLASPLTMTDAFVNITASTITNNYGIDEDYVLGLIHQWSGDWGRDLFKTWSIGATYVGTRGSHLDLLRAPNRGPTGLRISGVQAFTWQSSQGSSHAAEGALALASFGSRVESAGAGARRGALPSGVYRPVHS